MFKKVLAFALAVPALLMVAAAPAHAADSPITTMLAGVDLSTVSTALVAICLLVIGIALVFKGPDIAKRIIRKV